MSKEAHLNDLSGPIQAALGFMLGFIDHEQWDDALIAQNDARIREAILELKREWSD